ncbi:MAG TPA: hypothetical protein PKV03_13055 [Methylotenera sp.]|nr:hypothetical protein [Methylotenera sp.]
MSTETGEVQTNMPVLVALHGAGRTGASMIDTWAQNAEKHSFVVLAPNGLNNNWDVRADEADFILAVISNALAMRNKKNTKTYLFGHSNGAKQVIALTIMHPNMFDGVVAHAGTLPLEVKSGNKPVITNKSRIALFLGDSDDIFSVESGRQTVRGLSSLGVDSSLYILRNYTHWYYQDANRINESAWDFLEKNDKPLIVK